MSQQAGHCVSHEDRKSSNQTTTTTTITTATNNNNGDDINLRVTLKVGNGDFRFETGSLCLMDVSAFHPLTD